MSKVLYVASQVQVELLKQILIPQFKNGFWQNHRPSNHYEAWAGVEIVVNDASVLGAEGWKIPRTYNFVNPEFLKENEDALVAIAQSVKSSSNFKSVKKELIELSRIVGGRLTDKNGEITKANRGNNKTVTEKENTPKKTAVKSGEKRTAVKRAGATVTRVPVTRTDNGGLGALFGNMPTEQ
jgi:hypothetical protein